MTFLHHLTLNTGQVARIEGGVHPDLAAKLLPLIDNAAGAIPGMGGYFVDFFFPRDPQTGATRSGAAGFQIALGRGPSMRPIAICLCAWRQDRSDDAWSVMREAWYLYRTPLEWAGMWQPMQFSPPPLPWLATAVTPVILSAARLSDVYDLGSLLQCIAWTLMAAN